MISKMMPWRHPVFELLARYKAIASSAWQHRAKLAKLDAEASRRQAEKGVKRPKGDKKVKSCIDGLPAMVEDRDITPDSLFCDAL
jgi:hypothetical protein